MNEINEGKIYDVTDMDDEWVTKTIEGNGIAGDKFHKIRIESSWGLAKVFLDGQRVKGLRGIELAHDFLDLPMITLKILSHDVAVSVNEDGSTDDA